MIEPTSEFVDAKLKSFIEVDIPMISKRVTIDNYRIFGDLIEIVKLDVPSKYDLQIINYLMSTYYVSSMLSKRTRDILKLYSERKST